MTFGALKEIIDKNKIPDDVLLLSHSGWECDATHMDGIWYCKDKNVIVFTQGDDPEFDFKESQDDLNIALRDHFKDYRRMKFVKLNGIDAVIIK